MTWGQWVTSPLRQLLKAYITISKCKCKLVIWFVVNLQSFYLAVVQTAFVDMKKIIKMPVRDTAKTRVNKNMNPIIYNHCTLVKCLSFFIHIYYCSASSHCFTLFEIFFYYAIIISKFFLKQTKRIPFCKILYKNTHSCLCWIWIWRVALQLMSYSNFQLSWWRKNQGAPPSIIVQS